MKPTQITRKKLLQVLTEIEEIAGDDFLSLLDGKNINRKLRGDMKTAHEKLSLLYCISHSYNPTHTCHHVHEDWRKLVPDK